VAANPSAASRTSLGHDIARLPVRSPAAAPLPPDLSASVKRLSGVSVDDATVHYDSPQPATVDALAHAQGTHIHLAPQQEAHLEHETWHLVQQKQGRVKPTRDVAGRPVNDDPRLEREAEAMGATLRAARTTMAPAPAPFAPVAPVTINPVAAGTAALQRVQGKKGGKPKATKSKPKKVKTTTSAGLTKLINKHANKKAKNRHAKQDSALQSLISGGSLPERQEFANYFQGTPDQVKANNEAITKNVRLGGLNELLRTADTPQAAVRSMDMDTGVHATQDTTSGGTKNWLDYQRETSGPTENFIFKNTTPSKHGKGVIQDSHTNALMKEGTHPTVGNTSWDYHNDPTSDSLASNFTQSTHLRSNAVRNFKLHADLLTTHPDDILDTPADERTDQTFQTKKGEVLHFNDKKDLKRIARISAVRGLKELTRQRAFIDDLDPQASESESEPEDLDAIVASDVDSEDEADMLF
jgi:hypothetical protein